MGEPLKIAVAGGGYGAKVALPGYQELENLDGVGATRATLDADGFLHIIGRMASRQGSSGLGKAV